MYADAETGLFYNYYRDYDPQTGRYPESDPIGLKGGVNTYAYVNGNPVSFVDRLGLEGVGPWTYPAGPERDRYYQAKDGCGCGLMPDYLQFQLDVYVFSVSATYTRYGDVFLGKGISRQYWNPAQTGASTSFGWMLKCDPSRDDLNNFLIGWSASAGAYPGVGGSYSINSSGSAINVGVGAGQAKASASPGSVNSYQGNIFGNGSWK